MATQTAQVTVKTRDQLGTRANKRLRNTGFIPGVIYGHKEAVVPVTLPKKDVENHLHHGAHLFDLAIDGKSEKVLVKEVQYDHLGLHVIHVDFARVSLDERVEVTIAIELKGEPKAEGDVPASLTQVLNELELECLVTEIPDVIRVNVSEMKLDDVLHIKDLKLPPGVKCKQDEDLIVVTFKEIKEEEAAAEGATAEPEVIGRKPEDAEAAAEGAAEEKKYLRIAAEHARRSLCCGTVAHAFNGASMKLIVGLGNPGSEYVGTRHNIGFDCVDAFALRSGWINSPEQFNRLAKDKFFSLAMEGTVVTSSSSEKVLLLKPLTFMNLSGKAVQAAMSFYQLVPQDIVVVLDDLALPCGRLRLRGSGSSGGHNGLKDIERVLGTNEYPRLRIGIDPSPPRIAGRDYVLGRFTAEQRKLVDEAIPEARAAIATWIEKGIESAMSLFNADDKKESKE